MRISGRNFLPEICGEVHPKLPLSKLCAVSLALQNRACLRGEKGGKGAEKRGGRGATSKGGKKEKRTRENRSANVQQLTCKMVWSFLDAAFFTYSWKLPAYSGAFLLTVDNFSFLLTIGAFLLTILAFLLAVGAFLLTMGKCS